MNCDWIEDEEAFDFNEVVGEDRRTMTDAHHTINLYKQSSRVDFSHWLELDQDDGEKTFFTERPSQDVTMHSGDRENTKLLTFMQPDYPLLDEASSKRQHNSKKIEAVASDEYSEAVRMPSFNETGEVRVINPESMQAIQSCLAA